MGLALANDGKTLYAAAGENKTILKIDTATNKTVGEIALPGIVREATWTLDGKYLYTTLRKANKIVVVRTADDKIVATIAQKGYPDLVTMEPTGRWALVTVLGRPGQRDRPRHAQPGAHDPRGQGASRLARRAEIPCGSSRRGLALALMPASAVGHAVLVKAVNSSAAGPDRAASTESSSGSASDSSPPIRAHR